MKLAPPIDRTGLPKPVKCRLVGVDGNAFALMGHWQKAAKKEGWTPEQIKFVMDQATAADYAHLLSVLAHNCKGSGL